MPTEEITLVTRRKKRNSWLLRAVAVLLPALAGSFGTYFKSRSEAQDEANTSYKTLRTAIEAQRQEMIQFKTDEEQWHRLVTDIISDRRTTVAPTVRVPAPALKPLPPDVLQRLRKPAPAMKQMPMLPYNLSEIQVTK